ncbi:MAG: dehydratase [Actinobacteria bacterium]|nr:dehydratase [Actinomycetota bacterium]
MTLKISDVSVGQELPALDLAFTRSDLVAYANASGDQNPIHQDEAFAKSVGLPDVIAHGMLTMGRAIRVVTDWAGDPTAVIDYSVRMTRPVVVPDTAEGSIVSFTGKVSQINDDGTIQVDIGAVFGETKVLGLAKATVRLAQ